MLENNRLQNAITFGLVGGIIMIILQLMIYFINPTYLAKWTAHAVYIPTIFLMVFGAITQRKKEGGFLEFGPTFLQSFIIGLTGALVLILFSFVLYYVIDPDLEAIVAKEAINNAVDMMEKFGSSVSDIDEAIARMEEQSFAPNAMTVVWGMLSAAFISAIFSLPISLAVRRKPVEGPTIDNTSE